MLVSLLDPNDTIAAIASPAGPALRGIIRLSGPESWSIATDGFTAEVDRPLPTRAELRCGVLRVAGLRPAIPASIAFWPAPRTYTGQQLAEVHTLGAQPVLECVLAHYLGLGARLAEKGEFTLRAFLAGRIDLTRAEAVLSVIDARSPSQLDAALEQLAGGLSSSIDELRDRLLDLLAHIEAGLDFVDEEDVDMIARESLARQIAESSAAISEIVSRFRGRDRPGDCPKVVLAGPPNAGKSRLFNALIGSSEAIVAPIPGTTRDYLSRRVRLDGLEVELIDTAGIQAPTDSIEQDAQDAGARQADIADLVIRCHSGDTRLIGPEPSGRARLDIWTKSDLAPAPHGMLSTSSVRGDGIESLKRSIASALRTSVLDSDPLSATGARCRDGLESAANSLLLAAERLRIGGEEELVSIDLRHSIDELGKVVGAVVTDDILDRIFQRFCIGK
jgi:tRNA modification GTPase